MRTHIPNLLPKLTKTQELILYLLFKFRFLTTQHIQKLLHLKNPQYAQLLLKDLKEKGIINTKYNPTSFVDKTKPAIYFLSSKAIRILKKNKNCNKDALHKIYKEHLQTDSFVAHCLKIVDVYFSFAENIKADETLFFITESELLQYGYFPETLPSAYIALKDKEKTKRYFLEVFRDFATSGNLRFRLREYLAYADSGKWEENGNGQKFPSLLFVSPTENKKKHILFYAKALFDKEYEVKFSLFVTSITRILQTKNTHVWEKVED
ncbi:MAG: replication-relaxation family protein [Patescibacteria group bacterium]|nr:replication-relaxation family protein [Patescibacteria group bacterium]